MSLLDYILGSSKGVSWGRRSQGARYLPFTEPRYTGSFNLDILTQQRVSSRHSIDFASKAMRVARPGLPLYLYEDRRRWHPLGATAFPRSVTETYPTITDVDTIPTKPYYPPGPYKPGRYDPSYPPDWRKVTTPPQKVDFSKSSDQTKVYGSTYGFENPFRTVICMRRRIRREVMHALGFSGRAYKKHHMSPYSNVRCF